MPTWSIVVVDFYSNVSVIRCDVLQRFGDVFSNCERRFREAVVTFCEAAVVTLSAEILTTLLTGVFTTFFRCFETSQEKRPTTRRQTVTAVTTTTTTWATTRRTRLGRPYINKRHVEHLLWHIYRRDEMLFALFNKKIGWIFLQRIYKTEEFRRMKSKKGWVE